MMVTVVCVCNLARAQQTVTVSGNVTDSTNNTAIAGASIAVKGNTQTGTITNNEGNFKLTVPQGAVLIVSSVNYLTKEVPTGNSFNLNIALSPSSSELNEVVVIGYGTRRRKDITGAVSTVDAKDITKSTALTPELALQGQAAGVTIISGGGKIGRASCRERV